MTDKTLDADVLIVGAGPVGLTLAMDLASHGVSVVICETRHFAEPPSVKCNHVSSRTMEQFRRLGVAQQLRDAGLPADYPNDVAFRTSVTGMELSRIPIPCRRDRYTETEGPDPSACRTAIARGSLTARSMARRCWRRRRCMHR